MDKSPDAFRTISEVAEWLGVQAHVLRFWESKFAQVKPVKRAGGRRYYRPADMLLLGGIKKLLHDDGLTIKGVQKTLREHGTGHVAAFSQDLGDVASAEARTLKGEATIVPFKSIASGPAPAAEPDSAPDTEPGNTWPLADVVDDAPTPAPPADMAPSADPDTAPPDSVSAEQEPEPGVSPPSPAAPPDPDPAEEKQILPSFLHRPAPATPAIPAGEPAVAHKPSLVVEAPDPPDESELPYTRGPLAELAGLTSLSAAQIAEIAPLAKELQTWLSRSGGAGTP